MYGITLQHARTTHVMQTRLKTAFSASYQ